MHNLLRSRGFTLVELMITLAILAIVAAIAAPSFSDMIKRNKRVACGNELVGALQLARSEAVRSAQAITVTAPNGIAAGITVYRDDNSNGTAQANEIIQVTSACTGTEITVTGGTTEFSYRPNGQTDMAAALAIGVCDASKTGETGRNINVLTSGVLRTGRESCS